MNQANFKKGCLICFSDKILRMNEYEIEIPNSYLTWFVIQASSHEKWPLFFDSEKTKAFLAKNPGTPMMFLEHRVFGTGCSDSPFYGHIKGLSYTKPTESLKRFEHQFHVLLDGRLFDLVFVGDHVFQPGEFQATDLFKVIS